MCVRTDTITHCVYTIVHEIPPNKRWDILGIKKKSLFSECYNSMCLPVCATCRTSVWSLKALWEISLALFSDWYNFTHKPHNVEPYFVDHVLQICCCMLSHIQTWNNNSSTFFLQVYVCPECKLPFCIDCDLYIHGTLHNCPGCTSTPPLQQWRYHMIRFTKQNHSVISFSLSGTVTIYKLKFCSNSWTNLCMAKMKAQSSLPQ